MDDVAQLKFEMASPLPFLRSCRAHDLSGTEAWNTIRDCAADVDFGGLTITPSTFPRMSNSGATNHSETKKENKTKNPQNSALASPQICRIIKPTK
ncbi:hypothetical protein [Aquicoccus sp. SU-CL01552]|uniref:hypothetical protein n=1 Tax=Aquicoccus sp. SU-CL01552 TaxID=3127656 RepID=UPI003340CD28